MFHRRNRIVLAAGITVALITAMAGPASAGASAGGQASTPVPVDVTGDISWTTDYTNAPFTGVNEETGTVHIALTDVTDGGAAAGGNSSTYSISYNEDLTATTPDGCGIEQTGSFTGSGPLVYNNSTSLGISIQPPAGSDVSVLIRIPYTVTYTTTVSGPQDPCNPGISTSTQGQQGIPLCFTSQNEAPNISGAFEGTYPNGTVDIACSGTNVDNGASIGFSVNGTLTIGPWLSYVALGDSYSSGNGTPDEGGVCVRSPDEAWPVLVPGNANSILPLPTMLSPVTLLACSGATSTGLSTSPGEEDLPAQINELTSLQTPGAPTSIVTVTIGGDDGKDQGVGFTNTLTRCASGLPLTCLVAVARELLWLKNQEPALLRQDFTSIMAAAPSATAFAVGYPLLFNPLRVACPLSLLISPVNQALLNTLTRQLDADIQTAAASVGATYVNVLSAFSGHELCSASPDVVSPLSTLKTQNWFHPNPDGQQQIASLVAAAIVASQ
jgi:lysophospholipase L1-like esterase